MIYWVLAAVVLAAAVAGVVAFVAGRRDRRPVPPLPPMPAPGPLPPRWATNPGYPPPARAQLSPDQRLRLRRNTAAMQALLAQPTVAAYHINPTAPAGGPAPLAAELGEVDELGRWHPPADDAGWLPPVLEPGQAPPPRMGLTTSGYMRLLDAPPWADLVDPPGARDPQS